MLDIPVYTNRAAVHDPPRASRACRFDDRSNSSSVDGTILRFPESGLTIDGRDVVDDVNAVGRCAHRVAVAHVAMDYLEHPGVRPRRRPRPGV